MPAKITVQSGISAGSFHWIEQPVIRIGSDPRSDVCLPSADIASHALTLEYRDGHYRVYNRSRANVVIGPSTVEPGGSLPWPDGVIMQLADGIELVLDLEADPTPMPVRAPTALEQELEEELMETAASVDEASLAADLAESDEVATDRSKFFLQLAVTILCLLGCAGLLARESLKESPERATPPSFSAVIRQANASPSTVPSLVRRLQYAESAVVRGNTKAGQERYGELRDDLLYQKDEFLAADRQAELAILDLIEYRLGQLE